MVHQALVQDNTGELPRDPGAAWGLHRTQVKEQVGRRDLGGERRGHGVLRKKHTKERKGKILWLPVLLRDRISWNQQSGTIVGTSHVLSQYHRSALPS